MGALHAGHLSLVERSRVVTDATVVSIFVNPTQFAPAEDLSQYPRPLERDLEQLQKAGVYMAFVPEVAEIYPDDCTTSIVPPRVAQQLEGEYRPSHFGGVCTVVLKLLQLIPAEVAFFGEKDFQQLAVIRQMAKDLNLATQIEGCPIIRESDGLAMSSRNIYLSAAERDIATSLNETLSFVEAQIAQGETDGHILMAEMRQRLIDAGVSDIDYAVLAQPSSLEIVDEVVEEVVALIACHVGQTRLLDNRVIQVD
jgi:pantoate--beta-alanine ligase